MKLSFDFNPHFWIGLAIFVTTAISSGTIHLTNMIPADAIPYVTAWSSAISIIGSGYLTAALGLHNADPQTRRDLVASQPGTMVVTTDGGITSLANKLAALPDVKNVISTPEVAQATVSDKVVAASELPGG